MVAFVSNAGPGCGKSSTIEAVLSKVYAGTDPVYPFSSEQQAICDWVGDNFPPAKTRPNIIVLAFNKAIATEMEGRLKYGQAKTIHSLGAGLCYRNIKNRQRRSMDSWKTANLFCEEVDAKSTRDLSDDHRDLLDDIKKTVSALKDQLVIPSGLTPAMMDKILLKRAITLECSSELVFKYSRIILEKGNTTGTYDFDDMLYLPVINNWKESFDAIVVDESQDLSNGRRALIMSMDCDNYGFVGDANQAVYFFAGADSDSMTITAEAVEATPLPLSTSYRCSKAVVDYAQQFMTYGRLVSAPSAPEGLVKQETPEFMYKELKEDDMVLCRTNAPLVSIAWALIRQKRPARFVGRDLGGSLRALVKKVTPKSGSLRDMPSRIANYYDKQKEVLTSKKYDTTLAEQVLEDQCTCLYVLIPEVDSISELNDAIKSIFNDKQTKGIRLASIHRSKGLEAKRIFWFAPENTPHKMADSPQALAQEKNLQFVASTRAMNDLYLIPAPKKEAND